MFGLSHEIPEAKKQVEGIAFIFFGVPRTGGFLDLEFQYLWTKFVDAKFLLGSSPRLSTHKRLAKCRCIYLEISTFQRSNPTGFNIILIQHESTPRLPTWFTWLFQPTWWPPRRISIWQCFLTLVRSFEWPQFPKLWLLRCQNFLRNFLPSVPLGSACGLGQGAAAPEASHRCMAQPWEAMFQPSSGSSRPRRRWMRRRTSAVASDEGFGVGKPLEAMGSLREEMDEMLIRFMVQVFIWFLFSVLRKVSVKTCAAPFCFVLCGHDISRLCPLSTLSCFLWKVFHFKTCAPAFGVSRGIYVFCISKKFSVDDC